MTKEELAQKIKDSNYTCDGINCSECISVNGFGCCLQCDKKLFVSLVLPAKSKKDKLGKRIEELEKENEQLKSIAEFQQSSNMKRHFEIQKLEKENAELKEELKNWKDEWQEQVQKAIDEGYARTLQTIQLTKAKEHIRTLISCLIDWVQEGDKDYYYIADAEQFLRENEETDNYNANCNLALITGKLGKAIDLLRMCQNTYLRNPELKISVEHFLQENK